MVQSDKVREHRDYRAAADALKAAQRAAERVPSVADVVMSVEMVRLANQNVEAARRRVAQVEEELERLLLEHGDPPPQ